MFSILTFLEKLFLNVFAVPNQQYYLVLRIANMAGDDIVVKPSDGDPAGGFMIRKKTLVVITKKVKSPLSCNFEAFLKADETKKLFINYRSMFELKPTPTKSTPAITLTVTKNRKY